MLRSTPNPPKKHKTPPSCQINHARQPTLHSPNPTLDGSPVDFLAFALDLVAAEMNIPRENFQPLERKLRLERGGDRHYIASAVAMEVQERHAAIWDAFKKGQTPRQISECLGISQRRVQQIIARTPMP